PDSLQYTELPPMPVPVDDAVAVVYADRYIYLVSGWHDTDNVDLVQLLDLETLSWSRATGFPGPPVFGHAGGISGQTPVICDGVKVVPKTDGTRQFSASRACFKGQINAANPNKIEWERIEHPPGPARYRMAATGSPTGRIYFAGGSDNPYNYNGIGYDGVPSSPSSEVFAYDVASSSWLQLASMPFASMDHRALLPLHDGYLLVGGMGSGQTVLNRTLLLDLE
ncbi:MAG: galactose oxidase, partial [Gammaproteobacteria bacterium]|nr:galactose oxidase [Gammaproteobacteria bacterium]